MTHHHQWHPAYYWTLTNKTNTITWNLVTNDPAYHNATPTPTFACHCGAIKTHINWHLD